MIWLYRECGRVASIHIESSDHGEVIPMGSEREDYCAVCDSYTRQVLQRHHRESILSKGCGAENASKNASNKDEAALTLIGSR